jgi:hypothetical protein
VSIVLGAVLIAAVSVVGGGGGGAVVGAGVTLVVPAVESVTVVVSFFVQLTRKSPHRADNIKSLFIRIGLNEKANKSAKA